MSVSPGVVTCLASLGAVVVVVVAFVALGGRCMGVLEQTFVGAAVVNAASESSGVALACCKCGCVVAERANCVVDVVAFAFAVVVIVIAAGDADETGDAAARAADSSGLGDGRV